MTNILFRLLRDFDLDLRHVPTVARRAGVTVIRHRKPSEKIDVFDGVLHFCGTTKPVRFILGINPGIGGLLSLRTATLIIPAERTQLSETAERWFHEVWASAPGHPRMTVHDN
jgi:hypothetical protein